MNTEMNSSTDIRMTDVSVFGRSYEQVHGLGSRPAAERVFGSPGAESAAVPDKKVVKSRASGRKSSRSHTKTDLDGEQKFYLCKKCGNLAGMLNDSGAEIKCCDSSMDRLTAVSMGQVSVRADGDKIYVDFSKVPHTVGHDHHIDGYISRPQEAVRDRFSIRICFRKRSLPSMTEMSSATLSYSAATTACGPVQNSTD